MNTQHVRGTCKINNNIIINYGDYKILIRYGCSYSMESQESLKFSELESVVTKGIKLVI